MSRADAVLFESVSSSRGAPMGRHSIDTGDYGRVHVRRVRMVDHDYDPGGAYWGGGGIPLFVVWAWQTEAEGFELGLRQFVRAQTASEARRARTKKMTRKEQVHAVRQLADDIREEMIGHIEAGRIPSEWDEIELRWLLGEIFWNNYLGHAPIKPRDKRHREFKRHIFNTEGF